MPGAWCVQAVLCALDVLLLSEPGAGSMMRHALEERARSTWEKLCGTWLPEGAPATPSAHTVRMCRAPPACWSQGCLARRLGPWQATKALHLPMCACVHVRVRVRVAQLAVAYRTLQLHGSSYSYLLARAVAACVWEARGLVGGEGLDPCDRRAWRRLRDEVYGGQGEAALEAALPAGVRRVAEEWRAEAGGPAGRAPQQRMDVQRRVEVLSSLLHFALLP